MRFDWNQDKNDANVRKHGLEFEDVIPVFADQDRLERYDDAHSDDEDRWITIGRPDPLSNLLLMVVYTERYPDITWIISARKADPEDVRRYRSRLPRI